VTVPPLAAGSIRRLWLHRDDVSCRTVLRLVIRDAKLHRALQCADDELRRGETVPLAVALREAEEDRAA
jgi:hypothetical protein